MRGVGVPAVAVGLADAVEQPDQVLDDRDHLLGLLAPGRGLVARDRRGRVEDADLQRLVAAPALGDAELDAGAGLERGHALGQRVGAHVDVGAVLLRQEAESLLRVVPLHLASGHGPDLSSHARGPAPQRRASLGGAAAAELQRPRSRYSRRARPPAIAESTMTWRALRSRALADHQPGEVSSTRRPQCCSPRPSRVVGRRRSDESAGSPVVARAPSSSSSGSRCIGRAAAASGDEVRTRPTAAAPPPTAQYGIRAVRRRHVTRGTTATTRAGVRADQAAGEHVGPPLRPAMAAGDPAARVAATLEVQRSTYDGFGRRRATADQAGRVHEDQLVGDDRPAGPPATSGRDSLAEARPRGPGPGTCTVGGDLAAGRPRTPCVRRRRPASGHTTTSLGTPPTTG